MKTVKIFCTLSLLLFALQFAAAQTPAQNKETAKKIMAAVDAGDLNAFAMYVGANLVEHTPPPPGFPKASSDFEMDKMLIAAFHQAFPDGKATILNIVAEGDMVIVHSRYTGTQKGEFMGMPASNKPVDFEQVDVMRFDAKGKGIEHWAIVDNMTMMMQLGALPGGGK